MNLSRHVDAHYDYYKHLVKDDGDSAQKHRDFYDEYLSVMDLTEEFYIQTLREVFQDYTLANGTMMHRGTLGGALRDHQDSSPHRRRRERRHFRHRPNPGRA